MSDDTEKSTGDLKREAEREMLIAIRSQARVLQTTVGTSSLLELSQAYANVMAHKAPSTSRGTGTGPVIA